MDEFTKKIESAERSNLDKAYWYEKLTTAQTARDEWDTAAEECIKIRDNDLPSRPLGAAEKYKGTFYKDNEIHKANEWLKSLLMSSDIYFDLKSANGDETDENRQLLEMEVNFAADQFKSIIKSADVIDDWAYLGFGALYTQWNARAITDVWKTGKPEIRWFDARNIWIDEGTELKDWSDIRYLFALSSLDVKTAKKVYPEHADEIQASYDVERARKNGQNDVDKVDIYLVQYKELYLTKKIEVFNTNTGESHFFLRDELDAYLESGEQIPETYEIKDEFEVEEYLWFQFHYCPQLSLVLNEPKFIGFCHSFQFFLGYITDIDVYPRSRTWYMKDLQEIQVIMLTYLVMQIAKLGKATPIIREGAIDEEDFKNNRNNLDYVITVNEEWARTHPSEKAIEWDHADVRPDLFVLISQMLSGSIKSTSGAIDAARGEQSYSGQSGVQTAQLQAAASVYTKMDEIKFHNFLNQHGEKLKYDIAKYRIHEHDILGINNQGQPEMMTVNKDDIPQFDPEKYYCIATVENSPETMKQMAKDRAIQLNGTGKMNTVDMLDILDYQNPEQMYNRALEEQGLLSGATMLKENPMLSEVLQIFATNPDLLNQFLQANQQSSEPVK